MKIVVDHELCEANAKCMQACPDVFHVDEEDDLHVKIEEPGTELLDQVRAAVIACPKRAIRLEGV